MFINKHKIKEMVKIFFYLFSGISAFVIILINKAIFISFDTETSKWDLAWIVIISFISFELIFQTYIKKYHILKYLNHSFPNVKVKPVNKNVKKGKKYLDEIKSTKIFTLRGYIYISEKTRKKSSCIC